MRKPLELVGRCCATFAVLGLSLTGCATGYMDAADLDRRGQGPSACSKSCQDIGMRMVAMVLVSDQLPGCVCQVMEEQKAPAPATPPAAEQNTPTESSAASTVGVVVVAASVAREKQRQEDRDRSQKGN
jgi:hypothetical protein